MEDLHLVGERDDPRTAFDIRAGKAGGYALTVPALLDLHDDARDRSGEADALGEVCAGFTVRASGEFAELLALREALQRRNCAPGRGQSPGFLEHRAHPLAGTGDVGPGVSRYPLELVCAEGTRRLVGERGAPNGVDEGGVVDFAALAFVEPQLPGRSGGRSGMSGVPSPAGTLGRGRWQARSRRAARPA